MKQLLLARHAKSTWKDKEVEDIDRPLKESGINEAYKIAKKLEKLDCYPDKIITSPANRAIHTALIYSRLLKYASKKIDITYELYLPKTDKLFKFIKDLDNADSTIMIVGHNPSFTEIANMLLKEKVEEIETAGVVAINFKVKHWSEITSKSGKLEFNISPE